MWIPTRKWTYYLIRECTIIACSYDYADHCAVAFHARGELLQNHFENLNDLVLFYPMRYDY